jgi:hypothetical protein
VFLRIKPATIARPTDTKNKFKPTLLITSRIERSATPIRTQDKMGDTR